MDTRKFAEKICGEIVLAENSGETMKKWRNIFSVSQSDLAKKLGISPSVISDYEANRRSPGILFIRKFVNALIDIDMQRGSGVISRFINLFDLPSAIIDIVEYSKSVKIEDFCNVIEGKRLNEFEKLINGHTIIDSLNAILKFNSYDFYRLFGLTSERALIFTKVSSGKSPMVAIRVSSLKPSTVVLHGISRVDEIALKLAEIEKIPLIKTELEISDVVENLRRSFL
ncbi:MAG: helix-turn-helix domain-containing protein [Archaeoglobaceae archaeon]|nr:helix-turn-helix domain-containing protein [Archaeoglobaceae archaeon]MDW7989530.1 helix-turn-helix domain-containing protein [Archaeoglobaceae archaeon]